MWREDFETCFLCHWFPWKISISLVLVRQPSSLKNTRKFRQLSFSCVQKIRVHVYEEEKQQQVRLARLGQRHLALAIPCPSASLTLSHRSALTSMLSGSHLGDLLPVLSSCHPPTALVSSSGAGCEFPAPNHGSSLPQKEAYDGPTA